MLEKFNQRYAELILEAGRAKKTAAEKEIDVKLKKTEEEVAKLKDSLDKEKKETEAKPKTVSKKPVEAQPSQTSQKEEPLDVNINVTVD